MAMRTDRNLPIWRAFDDLAEQDRLAAPEAYSERTAFTLDALAHLTDPESLVYITALVELGQRHASSETAAVDFGAGFCRGFQLGVRAQQIADDLARQSA